MQHSIKYIIGILMVCVIMQVPQSQTFKAIPVSLKNNHISDVVSNYEVFKLDFRDVTDYVQSRSVKIQCKFIMGANVFEWTLEQNPILRTDAQGTTMRNGMYEKLEFDRSCRTFTGYQPGSNRNAKFTISKNNFIAMIPDKNTNIFIQPLRYFIKTADSDMFVLFKESDLIKKGGHCGVPIKIPQDNNNIIPDKKGDEESQSASRTYNCLELEVAFATDYSLWQDFMNADDILDYNLTIMNISEPYFDDFDLDFYVDDFFISSDFPNPWETTPDADDLLDYFDDWADDYFGQQDIGHLLSGINFTNDEGDGIIGLAWVGGACGDIGITPWCILENFAPNDISQLALLQAHEYGHLLDADHEENTGTIMEPSINNVSSLTWAAANIEEMNDFIEDEACIETCVQCPFSYIIIDYIEWGDWKYSAFDHITSTGVIDDEADVIFQSPGYILLKPGFRASSLTPASGGATLIARIAACE